MDGNFNVGFRKELSSKIALFAGLSVDVKKFQVDSQAVRFGFKVKFLELY